MKKVLALVIALVMAFTVFPVVYADEVSGISYSDHMTDNNNYDITDASIAWVKQATGALIWVTAGDNRGDDEIIAQAKKADPSLANAVSDFAVLKGLGTAKTPNKNGSQAVVTVSADDAKIILSIDGKYSHFVSGTGAATQTEETTAPAAEPATEPATQPAADEDPAPAADGEKVSIRIDAPLKMAVAFADGTIYYGGEMKEVVVGEEYPFRMCAVNWENGIYDGNENGLAGTVVYTMKVVHNNEFKEIAAAAKQNPERYTVKGIDVIDNEAKTIIVNCDAKDTHLETDVNNFFMAYRFHFENGEYKKQTGIDKVINTPTESLSVNLPLGSTITCNAYDNGDKIDSADVFIANNNGEGIYDDEYLTSVNDYTWNH